MVESGHNGAIQITSFDANGGSIAESEGELELQTIGTTDVIGMTVDTIAPTLTVTTTSSPSPGQWSWACDNGENCHYRIRILDSTTTAPNALTETWGNTFQAPPLRGVPLPRSTFRPETMRGMSPLS